MIGTSLVGCRTLRLYQTDEAEAAIIMPAAAATATAAATTNSHLMQTYRAPPQATNSRPPWDREWRVIRRRELSYVHLESAAADLVSKPTIRVSIGTKMPPPPTPPTVPQADPTNPITVATATLHPNSSSCSTIRPRNSFLPFPFLKVSDPGIKN